jgi:hypothetical protein
MHSLLRCTSTNSEYRQSQLTPVAIIVRFDIQDVHDETFATPAPTVCVVSVLASSFRFAPDSLCSPVKQIESLKLIVASNLLDKY